MEETQQAIEIREAYTAHIKKMFDLANLPESSVSAEMITKLETSLAESHMSAEEARSISEEAEKVVDKFVISIFF